MMTRNLSLRLAVDGGMIVLLLLLMAFERVGCMAHEWLGLTLFFLFIVHHALNRRRLQALLRGQKRATTWLTIGVIVVLALCMIGTMVSAVLISRTVFAFLPVGSALGVGRRLHMVAVDGCFLMAGMHFGLHGQMLLTLIRRQLPRIPDGVLFGLDIFVALYGLWAFWQSGMVGDLLLRNAFAVIDYGQSLGMFFIDRLAIFVFFAWIGHRLMQLCVRRREG